MRSASGRIGVHSGLRCLADQREAQLARLRANVKAWEARKHAAIAAKRGAS
jgi:hypothetical protein